MAGPESGDYKVEESVDTVHDRTHRVRSVYGDDGRLIQQFFTPLMVEFRLEDVLQIIVGASVLAIPVAYTEEVWRLGEQLPLPNIIAVLVTSITFVALFVYFVFYRGHLHGNTQQFLLRVFAGYTITLLTVAFILTMFQKFPLLSDPSVALRRLILVAFPACFSATVVDSLK